MPLYDEWKEAKGGEPFFKAARNVNRNMDMHKEYTDLYKQHKEAFKQAVPKNFNDFQDLKYKNTDAWKQMVSDARTARYMSKNSLTNNKRRVIIKPNESIGRSVGAASKNYPVKLPNGNHAKFAEGTEITKIKVFAGKGTNVSIRNAILLENEYGISADKWQKIRGEAIIVENGKERKVEVHWYEAEGQKVKIKVKRYFDES